MVQEDLIMVDSGGKYLKVKNYDKIVTDGNFWFFWSRDHGILKA